MVKKNSLPSAAGGKEKKKLTSRQKELASNKKSGHQSEDDGDFEEGRALKRKAERISMGSVPTESRKSARQKSSAVVFQDSDDEDEFSVSNDGEEGAYVDSDESSSEVDGTNAKPRAVAVSNQAMEIDKILHVEYHARKEWDDMMKKMNTSLVKLGSRLRLPSSSVVQLPTETETTMSSSSAAAPAAAAPSIIDHKHQEERVLIKWKDTSYLHVSWETEKDLREKFKNESSGSRIESRLVRAREALQNHHSAYQENHGFNPDFLSIDRILEVDGDKMLIKWLGLGYDELSWEVNSDLVENDVATKAAMDALYARLASDKRILSQSLAHRRKVLFTREPIGFVKASPEYKSGLRLRDYQLESLNWLTFNWCNGRNSILADEMGLGKTAQSIAFSNAVARNRGPILVIAPLATIPHWKREFEAWTDMNVVVLHGNSEARRSCISREFYLNPQKDWYRFDVCLTNFETAMQEEASLSRCPWAMLIVDEAHRLKNRKSRLTELLKNRIEYAACLLLTGTPIQNNTTELWTLLNFVAPKHFSSLPAFLEKFGDVKTARVMDEFHQAFKAYMLRRYKTDVESTLPSKEEILISVELTELQKFFYKAILEENIQHLAKGVAPGTRFNLMNLGMQLRKCCQHPYLIEGVEGKALSDRRKELQNAAAVAAAASSSVATEAKAASLASEDELIMPLLIQASGKVVLLDKLLPKLKSQGHRVLIFSQFTRLLDILEDYLRFRKYGYERIDGSVSSVKRQEAIDRYSAPDSSSFVFLLSTRGCGQGINLVSADTVIMYDSDWNPQNDVQAQARCHRIGQTKPVSIYRFITRKTYENEMFDRANLKLGLDEAVTSKLQKAATSSDAAAAATDLADEAETKIADAQLEKMLKYGAYAVLEDGSDTAAREFCEANIDEILATRTKRSNTEDPNQKPLPQNRFSKATFVSNSAGEVDMEDPEFWTKVLGVDVAMLENSPTKLGKGKRERRVINYEEDPRVSASWHRRPANANGSDESEDEDSMHITTSGSEDDDADDSDADDNGMPNFGPLSMTSARNLTSGLMMYALGRWNELAKRLGPSFRENLVAKGAIGLALFICVWMSREENSTQFPFPEGDDVDVIEAACKKLAKDLKQDTWGVDFSDYRGAIRKSFLIRLTRELKKFDFDITRPLVNVSRVRERCRESMNLIADAIEVENYCLHPRYLAPLRGQPPAPTWTALDDKAVLYSFKKYGLDKRRKIDTWTICFSDPEIKWSRKWKIESEFLENTSADETKSDPAASDDVAGEKYELVSLRRLMARGSRVVAALSLPQAAPPTRSHKAKPSGAVSATTTTTSVQRVDSQVRQRPGGNKEADEGPTTAIWCAAEKERYHWLVMRWGLPPFLSEEKAGKPSNLMLSKELLSAEPPGWDVFLKRLPRKTAPMLIEYSENMMTSLNELDALKNIPPAKKGLINRVNMLWAMWRKVFRAFHNDEAFYAFVGTHFRGVHRHQKSMPDWWISALDMALVRSVCRYGVGPWHDAFKDKEIFPEIPDEWINKLPSNKDISLRFCAVVDWLDVNYTLNVSIQDLDSDLFARMVEKGKRLMSPPSLQTLSERKAEVVKRAREDADLLERKRLKHVEKFGPKTLSSSPVEVLSGGEDEGEVEEITGEDDGAARLGGDAAVAAISQSSSRPFFNNAMAPNVQQYAAATAPFYNMQGGGGSAAAYGYPGPAHHMSPLPPFYPTMGFPMLPTQPSVYGNAQSGGRGGSSTYTSPAQAQFTQQMQRLAQPPSAAVAQAQQPPLTEKE